MATRCCHTPVQASRHVLSGGASNWQLEEHYTSFLLARDAKRLASSFLPISTPARNLSCACPKSVGSLSNPRNISLRSANESSNGPTTSRSIWESTFDAQTVMSDAEDDDVPSASDPASSWEELERDELEAVLNDETNPAHWLREWAENKEEDMHAAADLAYSALSESACCTGTNHSMSSTLVMGLAMAIGLAGLAGPAVAAEAGSVGQPAIGALGALFAEEPANALSLPTWIIHVASVVEWVTAIALVWRYGDSDEPGRRAWKGLAWGMVPLLAGALCACTWHFFYNAPSLEIIVALQGFFTVLGNCTLWYAAFRIYQRAQKTA
ncbi:hypothetical protein KFL_002250030 [Klebsormidium nitens]|uniref:Ycf49-like protein n=1 Tax=Klebsormidium nitens TaxID=105231 RepID=A0A1Y1I412_KLENI|nr:hypothetical protein KFL_002250030 [Klebsormidium nitens]|eukprot:GAQ85223.1 hypothetical protein KFL_002250030 [Klebsormidium nitens]